MDLNKEFEDPKINRVIFYATGAPLTLLALLFEHLFILCFLNQLGIALFCNRRIFAKGRISTFSWRLFVVFIIFLTFLKQHVKVYLFTIIGLLCFYNVHNIRCNFFFRRSSERSTRTFQIHKLGKFVRRYYPIYKRLFSCGKHLGPKKTSKYYGTYLL